MLTINSYITVQGDAFDLIAKQVYGDEKKMDRLIEANPQHMEVVTFGAGVLLNIPEITADEVQYDALPPWRKKS